VNRHSLQCLSLLALGLAGLLAVALLTSETRARQDVPAASAESTARGQTSDVLRFQMFGVRLGLPVPEAKQALVEEGFFCVDFARVPGFDQLVEARTRGRRRARSQTTGGELEGTSCQSRDQGRVVIRGVIAPGGAHRVKSIVRSLDSGEGDQREFEQQVVTLFGVPTFPDYPFPARWCSKVSPRGTGCDLAEPWMERRRLTVILDMGTRFGQEAQDLLRRRIRESRR